MTPHKPKTAQGSRREIEVVAVTWMDLLGYGEMLEEVGFDPTTNQATLAIDWMRRFHEITESVSDRYFRTGNLNDAAVSTRDLSPRASSVTYDFLARSIDFFHKVNEADQGDGFPGARMVVAAGLRVRPELTTHLFSTGKAETILGKLKGKSISAAQAVHEALKFRPDYGMSPELQANFGFTKAYLAESGGSRVGFSGPNCFVELAFFDSELPAFISFGKTVDWASRGLSGTFGQLASFDNEQASQTSHAGVLDAFQIAKRISADPAITERLKDSTISSIFRSA